MAVKVSLKELFESGAHFGHQSRRWNPKMAAYLHGVQDNIHVFDLIKTKEALEEALELLTKFSKEGKSILILGSKKQAKEKVAEVGKETGSFYVAERWLGGTLTNFDQIKKSIHKLAEMKKKMKSGEYSGRTKKERVLIEREIARLERFFGGISEVEKIPDLMVVIDVKKEAGALKEARVKGITTIGVVDSNSDPESVDVAIPMNDDAARAISYVLDLIKEAILAGKKGKTAKKKSS